MRNRKVFRVLMALPEGERAAFALYLQSPLHNARPILLALYELLRQDLGLPDEEVRGPEALHAALPTDSRFSANYFDKLCAGLMKALGDFMALREFQQDRLAPMSFLLRAYNRHHIDEQQPALYQSLRAELDEWPEMDEAWLEARYQLEQENGVFVFRQPRSPGGGQLERISQRLTESYAGRLLELACSIHNYNAVYREHLPVPDLAWVHDAISADPEAWPLLIRAQYHGYLVLSRQDPASFRELMRLLADAGLHLTDAMRRQLYIFALNFCAFRINQGDSAYLAQADEVYLRLLAAGYLLQNGLLSSELFKNIISLRLRLGHTRWVEDFIAEYGPRLANPHGGLAVKYNEAALLYYQRDFDACIRQMDEVIRDVKSDMYYGVDARVFLLKALYERNLPDDSYLQESMSNAFRVFVLRNEKLGETDRSQYLNFAKLYRRLMALRTKAPAARRTLSLEKEIAQLPLSNRQWFQDRLGELD